MTYFRCWPGIGGGVGGGGVHSRSLYEKWAEIKETYIIWLTLGVGGPGIGGGGTEWVVAACVRACRTKNELKLKKLTSYDLLWVVVGREQVVVVRWGGGGACSRSLYETWVIMKENTVIARLQFMSKVSSGIWNCLLIMSGDDWTEQFFVSSWHNQVSHFGHHPFVFTPAHSFWTSFNCSEPSFIVSIQIWHSNAFSKSPPSCIMMPLVLARFPAESFDSTAIFFALLSTSQ